MSTELRGESITIPSRKRDREKLLREYPGLLSRAARRAHDDPSYYSRVFHGKATSQRVSKNILAELNRSILERQEEAA